jgi:FlaA1/EpsC-like NDP-sugar epimerase
MNPPTFWHRVDEALTRIRPHRQPLSLLADALVVALAWNATYLFRLGFERWFSDRPSYDAWVLLGVVVAYLTVFQVAGIPRGMWRFSGFGEIKRLTIGCLLAAAFCALVVVTAGLTQVPRAVLALHPFVTLMGLCLVRVAYRQLYEHVRARISGDAEGRRALVFGAGEAARLLLAGIHRQGWTVLGLLDDDPAKQGARIAGVQVLGPLADVARWTERLDATHVIVALPSAGTAVRRRAITLAGTTNLRVLTVPAQHELTDGRTSIDRVRQIEPEDLLGREPVQLDEAGLAEMIAGKTVLVTGAGGSIGSELCRQVALYGPQRIVLYELSELALYEIEQDIADQFPRIDLVRLMGDVKDLAHLRQTCARFRPQLVFHAAAFKHVPLMEGENAWAALRNNTLGTYNAALASAEAGAQRLVLISTDKAVNPTNVMGATKRAAEMVISEMAAQGHATAFIAVRFGNVLGSSGSVIPKFKRQIARGGPITVTDPEMIRYFMTISEAARLVLQASAIGASGQVCVLDMGEPVRIVDLARDMIRLSGHRPGDIAIMFTGLRPGEKLYEELLADADTTMPTRVPRIFIAKINTEPTAASELVRWVQDRESANLQEVQARLMEVVPGYSGTTSNGT